MPCRAPASEGRLMSLSWFRTRRELRKSATKLLTGQAQGVDRAAAFHLAGHAVALLATGLGFHPMSIGPGCGLDNQGGALPPGRSAMWSWWPDRRRKSWLAWAAALRAPPWSSG